METLFQMIQPFIRHISTINKSQFFSWKFYSAIFNLIFFNFDFPFIPSINSFNPSSSRLTLLSKLLIPTFFVFYCSRQRPIFSSPVKTLNVSLIFFIPSNSILSVLIELLFIGTSSYKEKCSLISFNDFNAPKILSILPILSNEIPWQLKKRSEEEISFCTSGNKSLVFLISLNIQYFSREPFQHHKLYLFLYKEIISKKLLPWYTHESLNPEFQEKEAFLLPFLNR